MVASVFWRFYKGAFMSIVANAGQVIGEFLGLSVAGSMGQFDVANNDKNDGKIGFLPKNSQKVWLETADGSGVRVTNCVLDSDPNRDLSFACGSENSGQEFGVRRQFVDATKLKVVLAALGENISGDFVKGYFKDIEAFKAKLEGRPAIK